MPSKWNDEAATQTAATRSLPELWRMMHSIDAVHGLYYAFMHFWIIAFGTSNFALRAPSAIAVGAACAGVAVLGSRLGTRRIGVCSALVFMLLPRVTWMGMEARSYALTATVAVWLTIAILALAESPRRWLWIAYAVLAAIGVVLNLYLAILVIAHGVTLIVARHHIPRPRQAIGGWAVAAAIAAGLSFPVVSLVVGQSSQLPFGRLTLGSVANTLFLEQYFVGATPTVARAVAVPPTSLWAAASILLATIGWITMLAPVVWGRIVPARIERHPVGLLAVAVPWVAAPMVLIISYSIVATPIYSGRYFSFTTPAVALLIGTTVAALSHQWKRIIAIGLFALLATPIYLSQREPTSKNGTDWQRAAAIIATRALPGQDIYYGPVLPSSRYSTSKIRDAYPAVLSQLHDITLKHTGVQNGTLWDSQWPLTHLTAQLDTTPLLWVVLEHYGSPNTSNSKAIRIIENAGLHLQQRWPGTATDVLLFTRQTKS